MITLVSIDRPDALAVDVDGGEAGQPPIGVHDDREMVVAEFVQIVAVHRNLVFRHTPGDAGKVGQRQHEPRNEPRLIAAAVIEVLGLPGRGLRQHQFGRSLRRLINQRGRFVLCPEERCTNTDLDREGPRDSAIVIASRHGLTGRCRFGSARGPARRCRSATACFPQVEEAPHGGGGRPAHAAAPQIADDRTDADAFVDLGGQRPAFGVHHLMPGAAPVMQGDRFPFVVEHRGARRPLFGVGDIVQDTQCLVPRHQVVLTQHQLLEAAVRVLHDIGDLAQHVLVAGIRQRQEAELRQGTLARPALADSDQRIVEPVDAIGDEANIRIEEERRRRDGTIERIIFVVELDLEASRRGLRFDDMVIGEEKPRSDKETGALRRIAEEGDTPHGIGRPPAALEKCHADEIQSCAADRLGAGHLGRLQQLGSRLVGRVDRGRDHHGFLAGKRRLGLEPLHAPWNRRLGRQGIALGDMCQRCLNRPLCLLQPVADDVLDLAKDHLIAFGHGGASGCGPHS